jgi:Glycosyl transferase family 11
MSRNTVGIVGGLGNQLFQYLFGFTLQKKLGVDTIYDISDYQRYNLHSGFLLDKLFDVKEGTFIDLGSSSFSPRGFFAKKIINRYPTSDNFLPTVFADKGYHSINQIPCRNNGYYVGSWQSINYTKNQINEFLKNNKLNLRLSLLVERAYFNLSADKSKIAAIHIRMGDYLKSRTAWHLPLNEQYYEKIMHDLMQAHGIVHFFIFSDGIQYIKSEWFKEMPVTYVENYTGQTAITDMLLMARFSTLIISASTFGWWSAAFAKSANIYAPFPWVRAKFLAQPRFSAYLPDSWLKIDSNGHDLVLDNRYLNQSIVSRQYRETFS